MCGRFKVTIRSKPKVAAFQYLDIMHLFEQQKRIPPFSRSDSLPDSGFFLPQKKDRREAVKRLGFFA